MPAERAPGTQKLRRHGSERPRVGKRCSADFRNRHAQPERGKECRTSIIADRVAAAYLRIPLRIGPQPSGLLMQRPEMKAVRKRLLKEKTSRTEFDKSFQANTKFEDSIVRRVVLPNCPIRRTSRRSELVTRSNDFQRNRQICKDAFALGGVSLLSK